MNILITGATGLVGKEIVKRCHEASFNVHYLTTSKDKLESKPNYKGFYWNPEANKIDTSCFEGVDAIINLAGATIAQRWTAENKQAILQSRTQSLHCLKQGLMDWNPDHQIKQIVSASAIGIYPNSCTNYYHEDYEDISSTFLGDVVSVWEKTVDEFADLGMLTSKVRIGLVLDESEGALPQMVKPIKLGMGAPFGSGDQWQSWIHIEDLSRIFMYILTHKLEGVFNGVAPNPVNNTDLTKTIAETLHKPLILPHIPEFVMSLVLGDMHILLFESQRVSSRKIEDVGFHFKYSNLKPALEDILCHHS